ncbi:hypothetical protein [Botrimarina hoheduenensis]|uniref:Chromosome partition protein Smc n=1 Tax=Botrimarina hoheduenensis TaxID=2528000 RepID=A0A5C5W9F8_9BACT|nr:hypothetical protein [Botrimarina hoheduenensis]TWT47506.1 hypothetical protein Pla111_11200 [Botrimarina hoheduenensis]
MDEIRNRVQRAHRRLVLRQWAARLAFCWAITFSIAVAALATPKLFALPNLPAVWNLGWLVGALVVGLLGASLWTALRRKSTLDAAVEIDRRFELRERIASTLALSEEALSSQAGAALAQDARKAIHQVDVAERFRLGLDRGALLPLAPLMAALVIATLLPNRTAQSGTPASADDIAAENKQVDEAIKQARKELTKRKQDAQEKGLTDASGLLEEVQKGVEDLAKADGIDKTRALVELNDRIKQLQDRRQQLGSAEKLREQMNRMGDLGKGPADKAAEAMKQGDWSKALAEMAKMQQAVSKGEITQEQTEQLAAQLGKMQEQLAATAQKNREQIASVEKQMAEAQRKGDVARAGELAQKLDQLQQQAPQMQKMAQMADQLAKAQQSLQQGDRQQAAAAMGQMAEQLSQMQQDAASMEMLDGAMTDIEMAKMGMEMAGSPGDQFGRGQNLGQFGQGMNNQPGNGSGGEGQGGGMAPDERNATNFRDTRVKQNIGRGASTFGGLIDGPSIKGEVVESIKTELDTNAVEPADPLTSERLPRSRREHAEEYFRKIREKL